MDVRPRASYRFDLTVAGLSAWFVLGLFLDAYAHNNVPNLETFFTWWHGVFYSGFTATAAFVSWSVVNRWLAGVRGLAAVPVGYALTVAALPVFALAGVGDFLWHSAFGIEQGMNILFSPTHLILVTSMVLIVSGPLRSGWDRAPQGGWLAQLPTLLGLMFPAVLVLLFLQYGNALIWSPQAVLSALSQRSTPTSDDIGITRYASALVVTLVVLLAPLLLLSRRAPVPVGAASTLFGAAAGLSGAVSDFRSPAVLWATLACGLAVEGLVWWLRPGPDRRRATVLFAGMAGLSMGVLLLGVVLVAAGVPRVVEYWTGLPVVLGLLGALFGVVVTAAVAALVDRGDVAGGPR